MFQSADLEKLIRSRNLISWASKGEFEGLSHQLINHLYKNSDLDTIARVIYSELNTTYGLDTTEKSSRELATAVTEWWLTQK